MKLYELQFDVVIEFRIFSSLSICLKFIYIVSYLFIILS